jgi:hypothetical protein
MRAIFRQPKRELDVELAPKSKGKNLIDSKPKFAKICTISESPGGFFQRRNSDGRAHEFDKEEWFARHGRMWPKIRMKLTIAPPKQTATLIL